MKSREDHVEPSAADPTGPIKLYLVGAGVSFPQHLTLQSIEILTACSRICSTLPQDDLDALPENLRAKCVSLWPLYQENRIRSENYKDVARAVLQAAEAESPVAWLTPGHPLIFDSVSQELLEGGRARGWEVRVVPAISSFDTIFAQVGYDPAAGLLVYEATSAVFTNLPLQPWLATLLLQPGAFGSDRTHYSTEWTPDLSPLRDYLLQFFEAGHVCAFVRSHSRPGGREQIVWHKIGDLHTATFNAVAGSTLFIPAAMSDQRMRSGVQGTGLPANSRMPAMHTGKPGETKSNRTSLIIIQATPFCNIDCSYCYLPHRSDRTTLTIENVQRIFANLVTFPTVSGQVTVLWHAGEPLVLGVEYYRAAFTAIRDLCPSGLKIGHNFQTNGVLIDDAWCDLIREWDVSIGVSIDGPRHINDLARKTRAGRGTYDKIVAGMKRLRDRNIPFSVISVLTRAALHHPDDLFSFYEEHGIHDVGFNIDEIEGIHTTSSLSGELDDGIIASFFRRFSELMHQRNYAITIRELEETMTSVRFLDGKGPMNNLVMPFGIITVDVHGNVYTFSPELAGHAVGGFPTFALGNIFTDGFDDLAGSATMCRMTDEINRGIEMCRAECKYFPVCGGGDPSNKIFENGTFASTTTLYCRLTKKRVADFVMEAIESRLLK